MMAAETPVRVESRRLRKLTHAEIECRMQAISSLICSIELTEPIERDGRLPLRWIEPAELVRRVEPFLVYN